MVPLHRFALLVAASTVLLIVAGGLVTSHGAGLAVPDWPNTYGQFMFAFPLSKMVGGIFYEHGHRLIASGVGCLTILLAAWIWRRDPRGWMRRLGLVALAAVILQGVLGGITVLYFLPAPVSIGHAGLAQIFFCLTVGLALFTSPGWLRGYRAEAPDAASPRGVDRALRLAAIATTAIIYGQIVLGATMRHTGAGLAIPDFPLNVGHVLPPRWDAAIAIHFAHRLGAVVALFAVAATAAHVWWHHPRRSELTRPATLLVMLTAIQIGLGALTVLSGREVTLNTAHVVTGALVLATSLVLTLRAHRAAFACERMLASTGASRDGARRAVHAALGTRKSAGVGA